MKFTSRYTSYDELLLDISIFGNMMKRQVFDKSKLKEYLYSEYQQSHQIPTMENLRYNFSDAVDKDFHVSYVSNLEMAEGESLFSLDDDEDEDSLESQTQVGYSLSDISPLDSSDLDVFTSVSDISALLKEKRISSDTDILLSNQSKVVQTPNILEEEPEVYHFILTEDEIDDFDSDKEDFDDEEDEEDEYDDDDYYTSDSSSDNFEGDTYFYREETPSSSITHSSSGTQTDFFSSVIDSVSSDLDSSYFEPQQLSEPISKLKIDPVFIPVDKREVVSEITKTPKSDEPTDLILFLRKHPNCEVSFALEYIPRKEIEKNLKIGRVLKRGNKLRLIR